MRKSLRLRFLLALGLMMRSLTRMITDDVLTFFEAREEKVNKVRKEESKRDVESKFRKPLTNSPVFEEQVENFWHYNYELFRRQLLLLLFVLGVDDAPIESFSVRSTPVHPNAPNEKAVYSVSLVRQIIPHDDFWQHLFRDQGSSHKLRISRQFSVGNVGALQVLLLARQ